MADPATLSQLAPSYVSAGSNLLGTIVQAYGLYAQIQDAKAQRKLVTKWRDEDIVRENSKYQQELALKKDELLWNKRESQKAWKWKEEDRNYGRSVDVLNSLSNLIAQQPVLEDRLMNIWRR